MEQAQFMWLLRMLLLPVSGWLTARGIGDEALWEAVIGLLIGGATAVWSWRARRALAAAAPPGAALDAVIAKHIGAGRQ